MKQRCKTFENSIEQSKSSFHCYPAFLFTFDLRLPILPNDSSSFKFGQRCLVVQIDVNDWLNFGAFKFLFNLV